MRKSTGLAIAAATATAAFLSMVGTGGAHQRTVTSAAGGSAAGGSQTVPFDDTTGALYFASPPTPADLPQFPPLFDAGGGPVDVVWVETQGTLLQYDSQGDHATAVALIDSVANVTVQDQGPITAAGLAAFDVAVVSLGCNYNFSFSAAELAAFEGFVAGGGGLIVFSDNPFTSDAAITPLLAEFGLSANLDLVLVDQWTYVMPYPVTQMVLALGGGRVAGGMQILTNGFDNVGTLTPHGAGMVGVVGDINAYAQNMLAGDNPASLWILLRSVT